MNLNRFRGVGNKEFLLNFVGFGLIEALGLLAPILTMPVLTRALGPDVYGNLLLMMTVIFLGPTFIDYGTQFTAVRDLAESRGDRSARRQIYSGVQGLRLLIFAGFAATSLIYIFLFKYEELFHVYCLAGLPYLFGYSLLPMWYFQGVGETAAPLKSLLFAKLLSMLLIVLFVRDENDLIVAAVIFCWPMLVLGVFYAARVFYRYNCGVDFSSLPALLKRGRDVFLGNLAPNFYNTLPVIFLGSVSHPSEFAQFAIAARISTVVVTFQNVLVKAAYPVLAQAGRDGVAGLGMASFIIALPAILCAYIFGAEFWPLFLGDDFDGVNLYLQVLIVGVLFVGWSNALSKGYFLVHGHDALYRVVNIRMSIVSCLISILSILYFGLLGGAIALTVSRAVMFLGFAYHYRSMRREGREL